jgi:hypothetical protein
MAGKTCLYCGKALVLIRVGAGGDFCSREHRNQYRLRRGMDCLAEANKFATLTRRRETPKILFGEAAGAPNGDHRAHLDAAPFGGLANRVPELRRVRKSDRPVLIRQADALSEELAGGRPREIRREYGSKSFAPSAPALRKGRARAWEPPGLGTKSRSGLRGMAVSAASGAALRVSAAVGFRVRTPGVPKRAPAQTNGTAEIASRAGRRLFEFAQEGKGAAADARLAFVDMGFTQETPARVAWLKEGGGEGPALERREM